MARRLRAHLHRGGIGLYLLSHTINNDVTHIRRRSNSARTSVPGCASASGARPVVGIALHHLSNAGIKEPNSGVNFVLLSASFPL
jgi:hypothetical protein